jgi:hypothetical protein
MARQRNYRCLAIRVLHRPMLPSSYRRPMVSEPAGWNQNWYRKPNCIWYRLPDLTVRPKFGFTR